MNKLKIENIAKEAAITITVLMVLNIIYASILIWRIEGLTDFIVIACWLLLSQLFLAKIGEALHDISRNLKESKK